MAVKENRGKPLRDATFIERRRAAVEELHLSGYRNHQIYSLLRNKFQMTSPMIVTRDMQHIRERWKEQGLEDEPTAREAFIQRCYTIRQATLRGFRQPNGTIAGRDFRLAHDLDKQIAGAMGVRLAAENHRMTVTMEAAQSYIEHIMDLIGEHVYDPDDKARLLAAIEAEQS